MTKKYNLLYVFADQWRRQAMGCSGEDPVITPNMDAFAAANLRCTGCTSTFPVCSPHRASLLTGRYPCSTGFFTNCKEGLSLRLQDSEICLGDVLKENGYQTAYIGKYHLDEPEVNHSPTPVSGAREWDAFTPPGPRRHGFDYWYSYGTYDVHLHPHYWKDTPEMVTVDQWSPEHETDVAIQWLEQINPEKPFAAVVSWNPPHTPYDQVPQKYLDLYKDKDIPLRANVDCSDLRCHTGQRMANVHTEAQLRQATLQYYAAVSGLDDQFGRLLKALDRLGLSENTIVVLTADHGEMMGSQGLMTKHVWYEESIGTPFLIGGPGIGKGVCGSVFGSQDQMPTLLSLLDLDIPSTVEGLDFSEDLKQAHTDPNKTAFLYACPGGLGNIEVFRAVGKDVRAAGWRGIRTCRYTYVIDAGYAPDSPLQRILYDLETDPFQTSPLLLNSADENDVAKELEEKVCTWMIEQNDPFYHEHFA